MEETHQLFIEKKGGSEKGFLPPKNQGIENIFDQKYRRNDLSLC
jgi:hypothetical protein